MNQLTQPEIKQLHLVPNMIETCARWNYQEWGEKLGYNLEDSIEWVRNVTFSTQGEFAAIAYWSGIPVGMSFLENHDADERMELSPWLSGVYVEPAYRNRGIAKQLVGIIENLARDEGYEEIYLHTPNVEAIYAKLGWQTFDEFHRELTGRHAVMHKRLA